MDNKEDRTVTPRVGPFGLRPFDKQVMSEEKQCIRNIPSFSRTIFHESFFQGDDSRETNDFIFGKIKTNPALSFVNKKSRSIGTKRRNE